MCSLLGCNVSKKFKKVSTCHYLHMSVLFTCQIISLGLACVMTPFCKWNSICMHPITEHLSVCMFLWVNVCMDTWVRYIQPHGLQVPTPIFQLLYCTLNPVNPLLFTLSRSSCSLCLYLSLSHTLTLIYSPSFSFAFPLKLPTVYLSFLCTLVLLCSQSFLSVSLYISVYQSPQIKALQILFQFRWMAESMSQL